MQTTPCRLPAEVAKTLLVLSDEGMRELRTLVGNAIDATLKAARRAR